MGKPPSFGSPIWAQVPMSGRRRWLLRKRMLCTRQQVLQVSLEFESQLVSSHLGHQGRFLEQLSWCTLAKNSWCEVPVSLWRCPDAGIMQEELCSAVRKPLLGGDEGWY